jgi:hypothetical protein
VKHPWQTHVTAVGERSGHDSGDVDARLGLSDELVLIDGFRRWLARLQTGAQKALKDSQVVALHLLRNRDVEDLATDEFAVGDRLAAARDHAAIHGQARNRSAELRRRQAEQRLLRRGRGRANE